MNALVDLRIRLYCIDDAEIAVQRFSRQRYSEIGIYIPRSTVLTGGEVTIRPALDPILEVLGARNPWIYGGRVRGVENMAVSAGDAIIVLVQVPNGGSVRLERVAADWGSFSGRVRASRVLS